MILAKSWTLFTLFLSTSISLIQASVNGSPVFPQEVISELIKSKSSINGTLTQEQIIEVEKSPNAFILSCHSRVIEGVDPGKVCDSAFNYVYDKCERLDNVPEYCLSLRKGGITEEHEDPDIQGEIERGNTVNILYDSR